MTHTARLADALLQVLADGADLDEDGALDAEHVERWSALAGAPVPRDVEFGIRGALTAHGVLRDGQAPGPRWDEFAVPGEFRSRVIVDLAPAIREEIAARTPVVAPGAPELEDELPVRFLRAFATLGGQGVVRLTAAGRLRAGDERELRRLLGQDAQELLEFLVARGEVLLSRSGQLVTGEVHPRWRGPETPEWARQLVDDHRARLVTKRANDGGFTSHPLRYR